MSYFSPADRSYYSSSTYSTTSTTNYYNDMYRSFKNLNQPTYHQPLYISTVPYSILRRPSYDRFDSSKTRAASSMSRLYGLPKTVEKSTYESTYSSTTTCSENCQCNDANEGSGVSLPIKKREGSYESVYNSSRSSTPPNLVSPTKDMKSTSSSTLSPSQNSSPSPSNASSASSGSSPNTASPGSAAGINKSRSSYGEMSSKAEIDKYNDNNDLSATATSNIQLNLTDDLTTQVDYYLNQVDYRMICRGKQIELESFELSSRGGLISKCLYLNDLLNEACMNESYFETDPVFFPNGKVHLLFGSAKDSEEFATRHSEKFNVQFIDRNYQPIDAAKQQQNLNATKKNVSFIESNNNNESILKKDSKSSLTKPVDSNSSMANPDASVVVSANAPKTKKTEGYEILTIKAKLKQRVGQNRTKAVELHDIDSIMRNVVTIIQDEFMKRFPSGPAVPVTTAAIKSN